jgi:hypothetical protein
VKLESFKSRIDKLAPRPRPPSWKPKATTAENRQALDRLLDKIKNLPPDAPPHPDTTGLAEAQAECQRVLDIIDRLYPTEAAT